MRMFCFQADGSLLYGETSEFSSAEAGDLLITNADDMTESKVPLDIMIRFINRFSEPRISKLATRKAGSARMFKLLEDAGVSGALTPDPNYKPEIDKAQGDIAAAAKAATDKMAAAAAEKAAAKAVKDEASAATKATKDEAAAVKKAERETAKAAKDEIASAAAAEKAIAKTAKAELTATAKAERDAAKAERDAAKESAPKGEAVSGRMPLEAKLYPHGKATISNPRRANSLGFYALAIIIDAPGILYKDYLKAGGEGKHVRWDIENGNVRMEEPALAA